MKKVEGGWAWEPGDPEFIDGKWDKPAAKIDPQVDDKAPAGATQNGETNKTVK